MASATVTMPVTLSIVNPPPEVSPVSEYVTVPPLTSLEAAVIPTVAPLATPSETVLVAASPSVGCDGATSVTQW
ncbi:hypothetical protein FJ974_20220 [Mesorhizobium sp. B1-1-8]|nr:hypothetical protein [Mesorhizobium sp. B1-1-8]UCI06133.1 hypothetical protein FJ974_20220 [Mesorhizobium sp. B1-1-8]